MTSHWSDSSQEDSSSPNYQPIRDDLAKELAEYVTILDDFHANLQASYDIPAYETFEKQFTAIRFAFKNMLGRHDNTYYEYINRSENRQQLVELIIQSANNVARVFQDARRQSLLDRVECTDRLEDLLLQIHNLQSALGHS